MGNNIDIAALTKDQYAVLATALYQFATTCRRNNEPEDARIATDLKEMIRLARTAK